MTDIINEEELNTPTSITDWENEPSIEIFKHDFLLAQSTHDSQITKIKHWKEVLDIEGSSKPEKIKGRSSVQPRLVRRQAEWRYSALSEPFLSSTRIFSVLPRTFEDDDAAKQNELLLNYQFDTKLNKIKFIDDVVRTTVNEGTCIIRTGWDRSTKLVPKEIPIWSYVPDPNATQTIQQALELKQSNPRAYNEQVGEDIKASVEYFEATQIPAMSILSGSEIIMEEEIITNYPVAEIINTSNIYVDPTCNGDINKALFIIVSFETNRAELTKDGRYINLDKVDWNANTPEGDGYHETTNKEDFKFKDEPRKKVVAYEYWGYYDIHGNNSLVPIVATWIGNTLIRLEENPYPDGKLPFVFITYLPVVRSVYGEPDASLLEENQKIVGAVTRGMVDLLGRSANGQLGLAKGMLDAVNKKKFTEGRDYEFNPGFNPVNSYIEHKYPEFPQSALLMLQLQNQEAEAITGVKSFSGGISGETYGRVVAGIQGALDASSKREMAILRRIAKGISEIGEKFIAMNAEFLSDTEVIRVTNRQFIPIQREDLKGQFDLKVDIATAEVDNQKAQDLGFMLQTIGPNLDPQIMLQILAEIADLKRMPALAERLRRWQPQVDPAEEQMKQLQLQEQQLKNQKLQSEVMLNQAKAQNTQVDTQATITDAELEASGIKHQRDMEKQQAQARANQNLEVTKAMLKPRKEGEAMPDIDEAIGYNSLTPYL